VRGAPLIGIAAAYGLALAAVHCDGHDLKALRQCLRDAGETLRATRPTAVNLAWALDRVLRAVSSASTFGEGVAIAVRTARTIHEEDIEGNRRIGRLGAALLRPGARVMTHCNAGALATGGYGTALGVLAAAHEEGALQHVHVNETRPLLQGARLTAWELRESGVPFTLEPDSAAGLTMRRGLVDAVITGADRIAANGDAANKIGTYQLAVLAHANGIPFYIAAPTSTIDLAAATGDDIPIEERSPDEVLCVRGTRIAPEGVLVSNPAFDVTPAELIDAIITENGVARPPYERTLAEACHQGVPAHG
jgi:methylthioribose-1-phosphate isomerase